MGAEERMRPSTRRPPIRVRTVMTGDGLTRLVRARFLVVEVLCFRLPVPVPDRFAMFRSLRDQVAEM
jgi:hypothetical protein